MKDLKKKLDEISSLQSSISSHIWDIFHRYIEEEKILFNSPDGWEYQGDSIYFYGTDGCMGCYDNMSLSIPIRFFTDSEKAFADLKAKKEREQKKELKLQKQRKEEKERAEFERLSAIYGEKSK